MATNHETEPLEPLLVPRVEAARLLGVPPRLVQTLTARGTLVCIRLGRRVLYRVEDLRVLARTGTADTTAVVKVHTA
jgi:hypothetical protein